MSIQLVMAKCVRCPEILELIFNQTSEILSSRYMLPVNDEIDTSLESLNCEKLGSEYEYDRTYTTFLLVLSSSHD